MNILGYYKLIIKYVFYRNQVLEVKKKIRSIVKSSSTFDIVLELARERYRPPRNCSLACREINRLFKMKNFLVIHSE